MLSLVRDVALRGREARVCAPDGAVLAIPQDDGTIHVCDIDDHHADVRVIRVFLCCADVRGITAAVPTARLYVMYNRDSQGHVASVDLLSG
jgi:hypothetical protein